MSQVTTTPDAPDLRQAAIALVAGTPAGWCNDDECENYHPVPVSADLAPAVVAVAFGSLAEGLYIADHGDGQPAVYDETRPPGRRCIIGPDVLSDRVWALLAAVIPPGHDHAQDQEDAS